MDLCHEVIKGEEDDHKSSVMIQEGTPLFLKEEVEDKEEGCQVFIKEDIKEEEDSVSCSEQEKLERCVYKRFLIFL